MNATVEIVPSVSAVLGSELTADGLFVTQLLVPPTPHALLALDQAELATMPSAEATPIPTTPAPPTVSPITLW
jgi:hypothetical protein